MHTTNMTGSGTIGETQKIDIYEGRFQDKEKGEVVYADIHVIEEAGSTTRPIEEVMMFKEEGKGDEVLEYQRNEFFDFSEASIPASTWAVPSDCPM